MWELRLTHGAQVRLTILMDMLYREVFAVAGSFLNSELKVGCFIFVCLATA